MTRRVYIAGPMSRESFCRCDRPSAGLSRPGPGSGTLAAARRGRAASSAMVGAVTRVNALPALLDAAAERDELAESVRAYGRTIDRWGLLIIAATHSEDITTPDGDGDWEVIESRLAEVPALLAERDALAAKLGAVRALHGPRVLQVLGATCSAEECDHEDACPLVDYTACGHCYDVGDGAHPCAYEEGGLQDVAHPCATRRALDFTEATA